jgi:hypothetical protein
MRDRRCGVYHDTIVRRVFLLCVQSHNEFTFDGPSSPLVFRSFSKTPDQRIATDLKNKNLVKQVNKLGEISRAAAEE